LKSHLQLSARFSGSDFMRKDDLAMAAKLAGMDHVLTDQRISGFFDPKESPRGTVRDGMANWRHVNQVRFTLC